MLLRWEKMDMMANNSVQDRFYRYQPCDRRFNPTRVAAPSLPGISRLVLKDTEALNHEPQRGCPR
jgi:hypothetical protein